VYPNWELDFFRDVAVDSWRRAMTPEQTRAEAAFLQKALALDGRSDVLDVPCGNGRHSIELARSGHRVTGFDLSEEFLAEARTAAENVRWVHGDMRQLDYTAEFNGAFCFGNSFTYLDSDQAAEFFRAIARSLKPGGRFALETGMAAESILPTRQPTRWFKLGDIYMLSENQYHPRESRMDIQYTFIRNGKSETRPLSSYVLTVNEICRMQAAAGLEPLELLGSVDGEAYQLGSPRLIVVSKK
jgi:SAM-dependent methyltransferase